MMKRLFLGFSTVIAVFFLVACQGNQSSKDVNEELTATVSVRFNDRTDTQEVTFNKGDTVLEVLQKSHQVEEENGMVTVIDEVSQDPSANTYWMYDVNEKLAPKGVKEMTVAEGDQIVFYLEAFQ